MIKSLGMLSLCMALVFVFATVSFAKTKLSASDGLSRAEVQAKLKKTNSIIKKSATKNINTCMNCFEALGYLVAAAQFATDACGGPSGSNYNSNYCGFGLFLVDLATANFEAQGCGLSSKLKEAEKKQSQGNIVGAVNRLHYKKWDGRTINVG